MPQHCRRAPSCVPSLETVLHGKASQLGLELEPEEPKKLPPVLIAGRPLMMCTAGEENVSVIVAPIGQSFRLQDLGDASSAAQRFLSTTVAPEGSDKEARLLRATER